MRLNFGLALRKRFFTAMYRGVSSNLGVAFYSKFQKESLTRFVSIPYLW